MGKRKVCAWKKKEENSGATHMEDARVASLGEGAATSYLHSCSSVTMYCCAVKRLASKEGKASEKRGWRWGVRI